MHRESSMAVNSTHAYDYPSCRMLVAQTDRRGYADRRSADYRAIRLDFTTAILHATNRIANMMNQANNSHPHFFNEHGQPIGCSLPDWKPPPIPPRESIHGQLCRLDPLNTRQHNQDLFDAINHKNDVTSWTYLPYGPFDTLNSYTSWMQSVAQGNDPLFFAIIDRATEKPVGVASYLRIMPASGSIEVGHLHYALAARRKPLVTEAMYLMMRTAFELGYRRYEWKCDCLNEPSRHAARRLGFSFEGIFRQATVYKGRNRDTAWFAVIDRDWPALRNAFETWLAPDNFDAEGKQKIRLSDLTAPLVQDISR